MKPVATLFALIFIGAGSTLIIFSRVQAMPRERYAKVAPAPTGAAPSIRFGRATFASWAVLDRTTGGITGSPNLAETSDTMSMIKSWIAADYLRLHPSIQDQSILDQLSIMIRDSDNDIATTFFIRNGEKESIDRMVSICGLTESRGGRIAYRWSDTVVSARDTARLGGCIADGRAAGPWTSWLLNTMRRVRGDGDFGPRKAFPTQVAQGIAIKNGWFERPEDGQWHFACLAIAGAWTLGVLLRYPAELGETYGEKQCQSVAAQLTPYLNVS
jgi:hypothetical protein